MLQANFQLILMPTYLRGIQPDQQRFYIVKKWATKSLNRISQQVPISEFLQPH